MSRSTYPRRWWLGLLLSLAAPSGGWAQASSLAAGPAPRICWQPGLKLRWRDFQASTYPCAAGSAPDERVGACCATEIAVRPAADSARQGTFVVASFFVKKASWVRDSTSAHNQEMLAHEQVHFDINELFARKIRQRVAYYYAAGFYMFGPTLGPVLRREIDGLLTEKEVFNVRFDQQAHRDPSLPLLRKWQVLVQVELAVLDKYAPTAASCEP